MGKFFFLRMIVSLVVFSVLNVYAEPTSSTVKIKSIRVYHIGNSYNDYYIEVSNNSFCNTTVFKIQNDKQMYSTALAAMMAGKSVKIEALNKTGCKGWGTPMQSIYIMN